MSAATASPAALSPSTDAAERAAFDYKPIPVSAPVSAVLGVCSLVSFLPAVGIVGFLIALAGIVTAFTAWRAIRTQDGAGLWLAALGLALSLVGLVGGASYHTVAYQTELPPGHTRLDFTTDISERAVAPTGGISDAVKALDGEKVFLKGYMYPDPSGKVKDLSAFIFVKDSGECCFGGKPQLTDMIRVEMAGASADFFPDLVSVAGTFGTNPDGGRNPDDLDPVFTLTATQAGPARTAF